MSIRASAARAADARFQFLLQRPNGVVPPDGIGLIGATWPLQF